MKRRTILAGSAALLAAFDAPRARANHTVLGPPGPNGLPSMVWVQKPAIIQQKCPEWCWAASSSMIFCTWGHPVDQMVIVQRAYGVLACQASQSITIAQVMSSTWQDDNGQQFQANVTAAYDVVNNVSAITNSVIVNELGNNRPLIYGNATHCMMVVSAEYFDTPTGPDIRAVGVMDPWPYNLPYHPLSMAEMIPAHLGGQMRFLASVMVA